MKKLCFLLCLLLTLTTLVACAGEKDEDDKKDPADTTAATTEQKEGLVLSVSDMTTIGVGDTISITAINAKTGVQTTTVQWSSDNPDIAYVDFDGNVTGVADGTAVITAKTIDGKQSASCTVKVTSVLAGINLNSKSITVNKGETAELTVTFIPESFTGVKLTWVSSDPSIASVENGVVTAHKDGSTTIAVSTEEFTAVCSVTVVTPVTSVTLNETELKLNKDDTRQLSADVQPIDATNRFVTWTSSAPEIVSVNDRGEIVALTGGTAIITASSSNGITATCTVTVSVPVRGVAITPDAVTLDPGMSMQLTLTIDPIDAGEQSVVWESSDPSVVTVNNGLIEAKKAGSATITVFTVQGYYTASCKVTVSNSVTAIAFEQTEGSLLIGQSLTLLPIKTPAEADDPICTWTTSEPLVASVDANGNITALASGKTIITATTPGGISATYTLTVIDPSTISVPITGLDVDNKRVNAGETFRLDVIVTPSNATEDYIIKLPATSCVVLNSDGSLTALRKGNVYITVTNMDGTIVTECIVSVNEVDAATREEMQQEYNEAKAALDRALGEALVAIGEKYDEDISFFEDAVNNAVVKSEADYNNQKKAIENQMKNASDSDKAILQQELDSLNSEWEAYQFAVERLNSLKSAKQSEIDAANADYQEDLTALKNQYPYLFE